jgi:hypothetical protein
MNNQMIILCSFTFFNLIMMSDSNAAVNIQQKKVNHKSKFKIQLDVKSELNENIDEHINPNGAGEGVLSNQLAIQARFLTKLSGGGKVSSNSSLDIDNGNFKESYDGENLVNKDNVDESLRKLRLSQKFNYQLKLSKKISINALASVILNRGHKIEQEVLPDQTNYHLLDNSFNNFSYGIGGKVKVARGHITQALYKYSEFDYDNPYTYEEQQGSDSRRLHSLGLLHKFRSRAKTIYKVSAQLNQVFFRDKLALDQNGFFQTTGIAKSTKFVDKKFKVSLKIKEGLEIGLLDNSRVDLIQDGDGHHENGVEIKFTKSINKLSAVVSGQLSTKRYKGQKSDDGSSKRIDNLSLLKLVMSYQLEHKAKFNVFVQEFSQVSNQSFGEFSNQVLGLGINKTF